MRRFLVSKSIEVVLYRVGFEFLSVVHMVELFCLSDNDHVSIVLVCFVGVFLTWIPISVIAKLDTGHVFLYGVCLVFFFILFYFLFGTQPGKLLKKRCLVKLLERSCCEYNSGRHDRETFSIQGMRWSFLSQSPFAFESDFVISFSPSH